MAAARQHMRAPSRLMMARWRVGSMRRLSRRACASSASSRLCSDSSMSSVVRLVKTTMSMSTSSSLHVQACCHISHPGVQARLYLQHPSQSLPEPLEIPQW